MSGRYLWLARAQEVTVTESGMHAEHGQFAVIVCAGPQFDYYMMTSLEHDEPLRMMERHTLDAEYCTNVHGTHTHVCVLACINKKGVATHCDRVPDTSFMQLAPMDEREAMNELLATFRSKPGWTSYMKSYNFMTDVEGIISNK